MKLGAVDVVIADTVTVCMEECPFSPCGHGTLGGGWASSLLLALQLDPDDASVRQRRAFSRRCPMHGPSIKNKKTCAQGPQKTPGTWNPLVCALSGSWHGLGDVDLNRHLT